MGKRGRGVTCHEPSCWSRGRRSATNSEENARQGGEKSAMIGKVANSGGEQRGDHP